MTWTDGDGICNTTNTSIPRWHLIGNSRNYASFFTAYVAGQLIMHRASWRNSDAEKITLYSSLVLFIYTEGEERKWNTLTSTTGGPAALRTLHCMHSTTFSMNSEKESVNASYKIVYLIKKVKSICGQAWKLGEKNQLLARVRVFYTTGTWSGRVRRVIEASKRVPSREGWLFPRVIKAEDWLRTKSKYCL